jgi:hypothetical protein
MAELTVLESKLGEVMGLAMAAQGATEKVGGLAAKEGETELARILERMRDEAAETEERCLECADDLEGKKTAILEKAREVKREATDMMRTYLGADADVLDGFEFLTMAEAGEVGHWSIVEVLAQRARDARMSTLAAWAKPIQERHFEQAKEGSLELARAEDPQAIA